MWARIRTLRIADGPDEAHLNQLGRRENKTRKDDIKARLARHAARSDELFAELGLQRTQLGAEKFQKKQQQQQQQQAKL